MILLHEVLALMKTGVTPRECALRLHIAERARVLAGELE